MAAYRFRVTRSTSDAGVARVATFTVPLEPRMTVLDGLFQIQHHQDPSLAFRCACRVGMCGTCAMSINAVPRLACKTRVSGLGSSTVTVAPLPHLPVLKDLVVSLQPFFAHWKRIKPALRPSHGEGPELARIPADSPYARESRGKRDCITCAICYAACGVTATQPEYLGPAAINRAFLRLLDPRDAAASDRLEILDQERAGVWRCHAQFNCTAACPKRIDLTDTIMRLKRALLTRSGFGPRAGS